MQRLTPPFRLKISHAKAFDTTHSSNQTALKYCIVLKTEDAETYAPLVSTNIQKIDLRYLLASNIEIARIFLSNNVIRLHSFCLGLHFATINDRLPLKIKGMCSQYIPHLRGT